jgi:nitrite reductase/ring-hydroxylating ferredoxin subunit
MKVKVFESLEIAQQAIPLLGIKTVHFKNRDLKVALARTATGFYAVADACPHMKASFGKGFCNQFDEIICPLHEYRFSLHTGVEGSGQGCDDVAIFPVVIDETGLYIELP